MHTTTRTKQFISALTALERDRDIDQIAALFGPESEIGNIVSTRQYSGVEGAREFWQAYRDTFAEVNSEFRNIIESDGHAALEWATSGTNAEGVSITYSGVSILEFSDGQISRFWAYFDPSDLGRQLEQSTATGDA